MARALPFDRPTADRPSGRSYALARTALAAGLLLAAMLALSACAVTKVVTIPVKVAAKTVETAADIID